MKNPKRIRGFMLLPRWMGFFFVISHVTGWILANAQTIWIVRELKKEIRRLGFNKINK